MPSRDTRSMEASILELRNNEELSEKLGKACPNETEEFIWDKAADAADSMIRRKMR